MCFEEKVDAFGWIGSHQVCAPSCSFVMVISLLLVRVGDMAPSSVRIIGSIGMTMSVTSHALTVKTVSDDVIGVLCCVSKFSSKFWLVNEFSLGELLLLQLPSLGSWLDVDWPFSVSSTLRSLSIRHEGKLIRIGAFLTGKFWAALLAAGLNEGVMRWLQSESSIDTTDVFLFGVPPTGATPSRDESLPKDVSFTWKTKRECCSQQFSSLIIIFCR